MSNLDGNNILEFSCNFYSGFYREEADVDEYFISGDHDHYISTETISLPTDNVSYEEVSCEPKIKKRKNKYIFSVSVSSNKL